MFNVYEKSNVKKNLRILCLFAAVCAISICFFNRRKHVIKLDTSKQYTSDLSCLLKDARDTQPRLIAFLDTLKSKYKNAVVIDPGVKQMPTIQQLLAMRHNNDASKITDYARATIGVENLYYVYRCLEDIKASNFKIVSMRDNFSTPYPNKYRNINIVIRDTVNNHLGEIQISTLSNLEFNHGKEFALFDKIRKIKFKAHQEKRALSEMEKQVINAMTQEQIIGNNKAFGGSMKYNDKKLRVGVYGILVNNRNEVLMVQEQSGSRLIYNFPGGGIENHEGLAESLIRECHEEIAVDVKVKELLYSTKDVYINKEFPDNYSFALYYTIDVQDQMSIKNGTWFHINNLPVQDMLPIDREFVTFLQARFGVPQVEAIAKASLAESY